MAFGNENAGFGDGNVSGNNGESRGKTRPAAAEEDEDKAVRKSIDPSASGPRMQN